MWFLTSSTVKHDHLRRFTNLHNSGRSILHCCWSTSVEQSTTSSPWLWTIAFRVSPVTENTFVWLKIAAPSDLLLDVVRLTNVLTYLLTYLLTISQNNKQQTHWMLRSFVSRSILTLSRANLSLLNDSSLLHRNTTALHHNQRPAVVNTQTVTPSVTLRSTVLRKT